VGPDTMTDPAFLVTRLVCDFLPTGRSELISFSCRRNMEDFVTWVDTSKLKRHVAKYNDEVDDFDMMEAR
jgi:U3 small nucleolar ribonucleoprotein protein IMP3